MDELLHDFIESARWFGGKGREFTVGAVRRLVVPGQQDFPGLQVTVELVTLHYDDGSSEIYQLPTAYYAEEQEALSYALIGHWQDNQLGAVHAYDALHDHAATPVWLRGFADGTGSAELTFRRLDGVDLDTTARSTLLTGEQSNSSVAYGDQSLMKIFRKVTPGVNPDVEVLAALTREGNEHVAALQGWIEADPREPRTGDADLAEGEVLHLGIIQDFLTTASDGWGLALASLRNLFGEGSLHAEQAGGDFASEAHRLGGSVADLHASMAAAFGAHQWGGEELGELADAMTRRLEEATVAVPALEAYADGLHEIFEAVRTLSRPVLSQRVHGDLHLGQTLRTVRNWKIIDFEGEPAKPLSERRSPDSPWRDVAGMLRSFDYAAELSRRDHQLATGDVDEQDTQLAREWADRNQAAFLAGYREVSGTDVDDVLVTAYAADKAVYETVYEARNRPAWLQIPLSALARMTTAPD